MECCAAVCAPHLNEAICLFQKPFKPVKYFSIDRVFRNENLDDTHLAEFHQIEGVVADYGLTLGDLIGTINSFFMKLGTGGSVVVKLCDCGRTCYFSAIDGTLYYYDLPWYRKSLCSIIPYTSYYNILDLLLYACVIIKDLCIRIPSDVEGAMHIVFFYLKNIYKC